jgi:hypothetical protein
MSPPLYSRLAAGTAFSCILFAGLATLSPAASLAAVNHSCGASIGSTVKTETLPFSTSAAAFVNLPGAFATINASGQRHALRRGAIFGADVLLHNRQS